MSLYGGWVPKRNRKRPTVSLNKPEVLNNWLFSMLRSCMSAKAQIAFESFCHKIPKTWGCMKIELGLVMLEKASTWSPTLTQKSCHWANCDSSASKACIVSASTWDVYWPVHLWTMEMSVPSLGIELPFRNQPLMPCFICPGP